MRGISFLYDLDGSCSISGGKNDLANFMMKLEHGSLDELGKIKSLKVIVDGKCEC